MKTEPSVFSIDDLERVGVEPWDGVRNYQARNYLRSMRLGDQAFFYHSNCTVPAIVGIMEIVREAYTDATALDPSSPYHDPRASPENPRWSSVDVRLVRRLDRDVTLAEMKNFEEMKRLPLLQRGNRLSVMPVDETSWAFILRLASR